MLLSMELKGLLLLKQWGGVETVVLLPQVHFQTPHAREDPVTWPPYRNDWLPILSDILHIHCMMHHILPAQQPPNRCTDPESCWSDCCHALDVMRQGIEVYPVKWFPNEAGSQMKLVPKR